MDDSDRWVDVTVEVPRGSRNKYEFDAESGEYFLDRMLFSSVHYPTDYGFIPDTLAEDGDALDALVLVAEATFPGCRVRSRPVGVFYMRDEKGPDAKILGVPVNDPQWNWIEALEDVPAQHLREITHFFEVYKDLEEKKTEVRGWEGREDAWREIREARDRYRSRAEEGGGPGPSGTPSA
jgi:inorganic pyrophosphatase